MMIKNVKLAFAFAVLIWVINILIGFVLTKLGYPRNVFSQVISLFVPFAVIFLSLLYMNIVSKPYSADMIKVGLIWWGVNLFLDCAIKIPLFRLSFEDYLITFALKYLGLIIMPFVIALVLDYIYPGQSY